MNVCSHRLAGVPSGETSRRSFAARGVFRCENTLSVKDYLDHYAHICLIYIIYIYVHATLTARAARMNGHAYLPINT